MASQSTYTDGGDTFANETYADDSQYTGDQSQSQYDDSQYESQHGDQSQYTDDNGTYVDEHGDPMQAYDEDGNPIDQPYQDQPYDENADTGAAMMSYDESQAYDDPNYDPDEDEYDDEDEYYDEYEEDYEDREGVPMMPADYYGDEYPEEYYDEDEEKRNRRVRRRRAWCCCLVLLCCLLILIILLIILLLTLQDKTEANQTDPPTFAPFVDMNDDDYYYDDDIILAPGVVTSEMAPYDEDCDYENKEGFANVWDQCDCDGEISIVPDDVVQMRDLIIERAFHKIYDNTTVPLALESCDPRNMALIWLASGDNRDSGEARQRFSLAMSFFALNGTIWDYTDAWLSDLNECLWLGVQCNNRDTVNSLALDTNNIFGLVSHMKHQHQPYPKQAFIDSLTHNRLSSSCSGAYRTRDHEGFGLDCHYSYALDRNHSDRLVLHAPPQGASTVCQSYNRQHSNGCCHGVSTGSITSGNQLFGGYVGDGNWSRLDLDGSQCWIQRFHSQDSFRSGSIEAVEILPDLFQFLFRPYSERNRTYGQLASRGHDGKFVVW
jgi:hypothetical protein